MSISLDTIPEFHRETDMQTDICHNNIALCMHYVLMRDKICTKMSTTVVTLFLMSSCSHYSVITARRYA